MFDWSRYSRYAEVKRLKKNNILYRQGDTVAGFYYLLDGKVMISVLRDDGYERIIDIVFPGNLIGEQMIDRSTSFSSATTASDFVLLYFPKDQLELLTHEHPEINQQFIYSLIKKNRILASINTFLKAPAEVQLAHFLLNLHDKKRENTIELTQQSIAKYIGKSRVAVWKVLKEWKKEGNIEITNQTFILKDKKNCRPK